MVSLMHPRLLSTLGRLYPSLCTVQTNTPVQDTYGQPIEAWAALAGHVDLPCAIRPAPVAGGEVRRPDQTIVTAPYHVALPGYYSTITEAMRLTSGGRTYNILRVEHDQMRQTTRLTAEVRS